MKYLLGYDIGSSSIKASLMEAESGRIISSSYSPKTELKIIAVNPGWAEQDPEIWWKHTVLVTKEILKVSKVKSDDIIAVGISYQMHGLVMVDKNYKVLNNAIIWCDSRSVDIGNKAFKEIGHKKCLETLLNSPGNFTASKLKWVMDNRPDIYEKIYKIMLPGDYIAMKMSGNINTTISGMSEGIFWDFKGKKISNLILSQYGISDDLIPDIVPAFSIQSILSNNAAEELGLSPKTKITYRSGDQPNNALSLNVLNPGEVAATAGTSGVIYGVADKINYDLKSRVNTFAHVNYTTDNPLYGILLCINGTGILNSWAKKNFFSDNNITYEKINQIASSVPIGSKGLFILPYGNGAERTLENKNIKASVYGLELNIHDRPVLLRAVQEGIVFSLFYGIKIMKDMGMNIQKIRAGKSNMFLSPIFREAFAAVSETQIELYDTDGSQGAARGAGVGAGYYNNFNDAFKNLKIQEIIEPDKKTIKQYKEVYEKWENYLKNILKNN